MTILKPLYLRDLPQEYADLTSRITECSADVPYDDIVKIIRESGLFESDLVRHCSIYQDFEWNNWIIDFFT